MIPNLYLQYGFIKKIPNKFILPKEQNFDYD